MEVTVEDLFQMIGQQQVEIAVLKAKLAQYEAQAEEASKTPEA